MLKSPGPKPHVLFGQGKTATTLLTEDGCVYPIISSFSYNDRYRAQTAPYVYGRGVRPMHRTTFTLAKAPWRPDDAYKTMNNQHFGGSKILNPVRRPPLCPSMHTSQVKLSHLNDKTNWDSHYTGTFIEKDIIPANRLHLTSLVNRIDQTEGKDVKTAIKVDQNPPNYWSQYNRIHGKLGYMLGPGSPREYAIRHSYNIITGEDNGPAWSEQNRRTSGNRVLNASRRERTSILN